jgi:hypothetical protein
MAITSKQAEKVDEILRGLGIEPEVFHDWVMRRVYAADESGRRVTRYRRVRGSHGESFVWDPEGTDELPPGYDAPKQNPLQSA